MRVINEESVENRGWISILECAELEKQVALLSDEALVEEIMFFSDKVDLEKSTQSILSKYFDKGLSAKSRNKLQSTYILYYAELVQEE